jgi:uncharacterized delta-60 repeat protein
MKKYTLLAVLLLAIQFVYAQAGTLDSSFGFGGKVIQTFQDGFEKCYGVAVQRDNKIITVGDGGDYASSGFLVLRFNESGIIDTSFNFDGRAIADFIYDWAEARAVAIQEDGKIVVTGIGFRDNFTDYDYNVLLARFNTNGNLDTSFGSNGLVITDFGGNESSRALAIQGDGKIIIAGNISGQNFLTLRYNVNGTLDSSFGDKGKVITVFGLAYANAIAIQKDGKIITAGSSSSSNSSIIVRYHSNGILDTSFGNAGILVNNYGYQNTIFNSIAIEPNGFILAAGASGGGLGCSMFIVRFNSFGDLDYHFGMNGKAIVDFDGFNSEATKVNLQKDSKIVLIGSTINAFASNKNNFAIVRLLQNGVTDSTFGVSGKTVTDFGEEYGETAFSGTLDRLERVIAGGSSNKDYGVFISRYTNNSLNTKSYKLFKIKRWLHHHGITWEDAPVNDLQYYSVQRSNGNSFSEIARVNKQSTSLYQFEDAAVSDNGNYRVAAISKTGRVLYSNVVAIEKEIGIKFYPNPTTNTLHIEGLPTNTKTKLTIADFSGNVRMVTTANTAIFEWNISRLQKGSYVVRVEADNNVTSVTFIKE